MEGKLGGEPKTEGGELRPISISDLGGWKPLYVHAVQFSSVCFISFAVYTHLSKMFTKSVPLSITKHSKQYNSV